MADGVVQLHDDGPGKKVDTAVLTVGGQTVYRQRVESYPANTFGDITADAWGSQKVSIVHSLDHGM